MSGPSRHRMIAILGGCASQQLPLGHHGRTCSPLQFAKGAGIAFGTVLTGSAPEWPRSLFAIWIMVGLPSQASHPADPLHPVRVERIPYHPPQSWRLRLPHPAIAINVWQGVQERRQPAMLQWAGSTASRVRGAHHPDRVSADRPYHRGVVGGFGIGINLEDHRSRELIGRIGSALQLHYGFRSSTCRRCLHDAVLHLIML